MDLLVKLYALPALAPLEPAPENVTIRRAFAAEKTLLARWIGQHFSDAWASESEAAFARLPVSCFVATAENRLVGFACYDATARGFFGPIGVTERERHHRVGRALLLSALHDMAGQGYGYAIIGGAGSQEFYRQHVDVMEIPGSVPGFYRGMLKE
ncbi:MAG: GNAT family N-acetyltransferase [Chthoniobacterales bacterium]